MRAWTVWIPEQETAAAATLAAAGHRLDATPAAMLLNLNELRPAAGPEPGCSSHWDLAAAGAISDQAYGDPPGTLARAIGALPPDAGHLYLANCDGMPASFVLVHDHDHDCAFWMAATVPEARGRGLLSGLLHRALLDARHRGCTTSTTQATRMGEPIYARLGYRTIHQLQTWERRQPASTASLTPTPR